MTKISIRAALAAAMALLHKDRATLALYVTMGLVVPYLLHASDPAISLRALVAVAAGGGFLTGSLTGPLYLVAIMVVVWTAAQFALWNAMLPESRDGPIGEIMFGFVAGFMFLVCYVVIMIALVFLPMLILSATFAHPLPGAGRALTGMTTQNIITLGFSLVMAVIASRLWLAGPIMAAKGTMNPLPALVESWRRTGASRGKLILFYLALQLVGGMAFAALIAAHTAIIFDSPAAPGTGENVMAGVWFVVWLAVFLVQSLVAAGLFEAARDRAASDVFA